MRPARASTRAARQLRYREALSAVDAFVIPLGLAPSAELHCSSVQLNPVLDLKKQTIALRSSGANYTVPMPDKVIRPPGSNPTASKNKEDFALSVSAPMSSSHTFRLVVQAADGKVYKSRNIVLDYFVPRLKAKKRSAEGTDE